MKVVTLLRMASMKNGGRGKEGICTVVGIYVVRKLQGHISNPV